MGLELRGKSEMVYVHLGFICMYGVMHLQAWMRLWGIDSYFKE